MLLAESRFVKRLQPLALYGVTPCSRQVTCGMWAREVHVPHYAWLFIFIANSVHTIVVISHFPYKEVSLRAWFTKCELHPIPKARCSIGLPRSAHKRLIAPIYVLSCPLLKFVSCMLKQSSTECKTLGVSQNTIKKLYIYQSYYSRAHIPLYARALAFNVRAHCIITLHMQITCEVLT